MKTTNVIKTMAIVIFSLLLSTSIFAQEKPAKADDCCSKTAKHVCTDECKTEGCGAVKAKEGKAEGCATVKTKECKTAKHVCTDECKTEGCDAVKAKECVSYECPMKCEPASNKPGECSKCGMELKKKA